MKFTLIILFVSALFLTSCKIGGVKGNGNWTNETRDVETFSKVDVSGNFNVEIAVNEKQNLLINADENLMKYIKTKVKRNTLYIYSKENLRPSDDIVINISVKNLDYIDCSGINNVNAYGIDTERFGVDLSGAGSIELEGKSNTLSIDVSGAAELIAKKLLTQDIKLDVSGAANAEIYASNTVDGDISGAGSVNLYGGAKVLNLDVSGAASLNRK